MSDNEESLRHLATIQQIDRLEPIEDADRIELAVINGWKVVVQKGLHKANDLVVFCEIDSWIPHTLAPFLDRGQGPKEYDGVEGYRLRTMKLRGQISQGLILPIREIPVLAQRPDLGVDDDVTAILGIIKYDPLPGCHVSGPSRPWPVGVPKTDQDRIQNLSKRLSTILQYEYEVTEKLEGASMTVGVVRGEFVVCSRRLQLVEDENNTCWKLARELDIERKLRDRGLDDLVLQGELIGPGVQGNYYQLKRHEFVVYDVYDVVLDRYLLPIERQRFVAELGLSHVPVVAPNTGADDLIDIQTIIAMADGKSTINPQRDREGLVFKATTVPYSFKAISNKYLLKSD